MFCVVSHWVVCVFLLYLPVKFLIRCFGKLFFAMTCMVSHSFCFLSWLKGREDILFKYDLNAAFFCSIGWLENKLIVVSVGVWV